MGDIGEAAHPPWPLFVPAAALAGVWLIFVWPWLSGSVTIPWDGKAHFAPQVQFMAASLARGEWPWWTPNVFAGHPQIADPQSMLFSPPFVLLALIEPAPGPWAIDLVVLIMLYVAGFGTLCLARDLGWHCAGALIAAIAFAFGAAMAWRLQHFGQVLSLAYLPYALFFLRRAILHANARGRIIYGALSGLFAAFIVLGRDQVGLLSIYLLAAYAVTLLASGETWLQRLRPALLPLIAGAVVAAALVAVPVGLTMALAGQSNRPAIAFADAAAGSLHPALLITGLVPHLFGAAGEMRDYWGPPSFYWKGTGLFLAQNMGVVYIGTIPFFLIVIGIVRGILWQPQIRFFAIAFALILLYALGWYTPAFRIMHEVLPGVSFYRRPADAVFLLGGIGALLAGYVASRLATAWQTAPSVDLGSPAIALVAMVAGLLVALGFAIALGRLPAAAMPLLLAVLWAATAIAAIALAAWLAPIRPALAATVIVALTAADVTCNNGPNGASALPAETLAMLDPDARDKTIARLAQLTAATRSDVRRDRVEMVGLGYHWPNTPLTHNLHSTLGANPVRLANYVAATGAGDTVGLGEQRAFPPLFPSYRSPLANLLGLRFIATNAPIETIDKSLPPGAFPLAARIGDTRIYENPAALPRVLFATEAKSAEFPAIISTGRWPAVDFAKTVLLESASPENIRPVQAEPAAAGPSRKIAIRAYRNTEITLDVDSGTGGWAVLNDVWHPWWQGEVDGRPAPVLKANVIFRAIKVPPGRHTVRFVFRPIAGAWADLFQRRHRAPSASPAKPGTTTAPSQ